MDTHAANDDFRLALAKSVGHAVFSNYKFCVYDMDSGLWRRSSSRKYANQSWVRACISMPVLVLNDMQYPAILVAFDYDKATVHHSRKVNRGGVWNGEWAGSELLWYSDPDFTDRLLAVYKTSRVRIYGRSF